MRTRILLIIIILITIFFSCGKKESSPTGPENIAPILSSIANQTVTAGQTKNVALFATDTDGDPLTFSIPSNPGFLSITGFSQVGDTATATLVIAPGNTLEGIFNATVQVSDGEGGTDSESFTIELVSGFTLSDIVGTWTGEASNSNTFSINLIVDTDGKVSGNGAGGSLELSATWSIDDEGKVTGSGVISIISGGQLIIEMGYWSLQLSAEKTTLTGSFSSFSLGSMDVTLYKEGAPMEEDDNYKWRFQTGSNIRSSAAIGTDGTIYIGSDDNSLYAINPDGTKNGSSKRVVV